MNQEEIDATKYSNLNKIAIGVLSISVPLSSALAGGLTYQVINYLSTKLFIQTEIRNQLSDQQQKPRPRSRARQDSLPLEQQSPKDNAESLKVRPSEGIVVVLEKEKKSDCNKKCFLNPTTSPNDNDCHSNHFTSTNAQLDSQYPNHNEGQQHCFESFRSLCYEFNALNDKFNLIAFLLLMLNLLSMIFEIVIFKSLAHHSLVDPGLTQVYGWPLLSLIITNYFISTGTRIYLARLASTMLRSPKIFLISSLVLLLFTLLGVTFQLVLIGAHAASYGQIKTIFTPRRDSVDQNSIYSLGKVSDYFRFIGAHAISLDLLQLVWLGPSFLWEFLISVVLLFNFCDSRKRCRFGSIGGKVSLAITLLFETFFLGTMANFMISCVLLTLGGKRYLDFERINTLYGALNAFATKLSSISILCSLQHKTNDRLRLEQRILSNLQRPRDSAMSGFGLGFNGANRDSSYSRRSFRLTHGSIKFPEFAETEFETVPEEDEAEHEIIEEIESNGNNDVPSGATSFLQDEDSGANQFTLSDEDDNDSHKDNEHSSDRSKKDRKKHSNFGKLAESFNIQPLEKARISKKLQVGGTWMAALLARSGSPRRRMDASSSEPKLDWPFSEDSRNPVILDHRCKSNPYVSSQQGSKEPRPSLQPRSSSS